MSQAPTLIPRNPLVVRPRGNSPTAKSPICITFPPAPGVTVSLPIAPYTNFRYSPDFRTGLCVPHPDETMTQFQTRVESVAGGAYVVLTIDMAGEINVVGVAIAHEHPYLAQSKYNYDLLARKARESVKEALRQGALVIKTKA